MAGGQERVLRRRIRSVQSTQKITRAQELIAASRIVRAQARVHAAQPYSDSITQVVRDLAAIGGGAESPLLQARDEVRRVGFIVVTADRGLAGAYNSSILRMAEHAVREQQRLGRAYSLVTVGRKAESYFRYREYSIDASFSGFSEQPRYEDARGVGSTSTQAFLAGETDLVEIFYTRFRSAGVQEPVRQVLMPLSPEEIAAEGSDEPARAGYEFEPSAEGLLDLLIPRYVESLVFAALLNAAASEHARAPAGDEGGHRQRRRADHQLVAGHEPCPPGLHHHRDHGDRQRRRGAAVVEGGRSPRRRHRGAQHRPVRISFPYRR